MLAFKPSTGTHRLFLPFPALHFSSPPAALPSFQVAQHIFLASAQPFALRTGLSLSLHPHVVDRSLHSSVSSSYSSLIPYSPIANLTFSGQQVSIRFAFISHPPLLRYYRMSTPLLALLPHRPPLKMTFIFVSFSLLLFCNASLIISSPRLPAASFQYMRGKGSMRRLLHSDEHHPAAEQAFNPACDSSGQRECVPAVRNGSPNVDLVEEKRLVPTGPNPLHNR